MSLMDHQLGFGNESVYGTPVTPTRFFEYESESIEDDEGRTEGDPLRTGSGVVRNDRFTPHYNGAKGKVQMTALTKGFGFFLRHMLGASATTGPTESVVYTHTGTEGDLTDDSFTMQVNRPLNPSGTNQPLTYCGGKITDFTLSNTVDKHLILDLGLDFMQVDTAAALAAASYPTAMEPFSWATGLVTVAGSAFDVTDFALSWDNGLATDRRQIRRNTNKKAPTAGRRSGSVSLSADFDTMTARNRAHAAVRGDALATLTAQWRGPLLLGTTIYPEFNVSVASLRFDSWKAPTSGPDAITQTLGAEIRYDGATSPLVVTLKNADTTA